MPTKNGDFLLINYTCKVKETGEIIDTTAESVAKTSNVHIHENAKYEPLFLVVGEGWVPKGLDEGLIGLEVGSTATIEVPPEKGYGTRDASKIRLVPIRKFTKDSVTPTPGMQVEVDGKLALVRAVGAGRVQVDYNHPLAGKTLIYEVSLGKLLETEEEKIRMIIRRKITTVDSGKFGLTIQDKKLAIDLPEEAFFLEGLQLMKKSLVADLQKLLPQFEETSFVEIFKKTQPAAEPKSTQT